MIAGGSALLFALACCCLSLPAALNPNDRQVADVATLAPTLVSDSARAGGALDATATAARPLPVTATRRPATATLAPATATRRTSRTPAPTATIDPVASAEQTGVVIDVIDGDTIEVEIEGRSYRVRYIGMDAPEAGAPCGDVATDANADLVEGQTVRLVRDVSPTDRYDRLLRYVYVGDVFVNAELIRRGVAEAQRYPPDTTEAPALEAAEAEARANLTECYALGVFGGVPAAAVATPVTRSESLPAAPVADTPVPAPTVAPEVPTAEPPTLEPPTAEPPTAAPPVSDGAYNCGGSACIKGNINSEGEHIYHFPGCASYNATKIDESKGERWFTTAAEAEAAGWRRALNCP